MADGFERVEFPYELLRRWPDPEAPNLFAYDATDRLLIDTATEEIRASGNSGVVVIGDRYGALALAALSVGASEVRVHQDSFGGRLALAANAERLVQEGVLNTADIRSLPLDQQLLEGARVVLIQLPKDLAQFDRWVGLVAEYADPEVRIFAGGRVKHMTKAQNEVLERYFETVQATLARQKSRVLVASGLRADRPHPQTALDETYFPELDLWIYSAPGSFAAGKVDIGSRFLVPFIEGLPGREDEGLVAADLGCGTGVLGAVLLRSHPEYRLIATDRSAAAVASTLATLSRNAAGGDWEVRQDHALNQQSDASLDLIVCNPPFHSEAAVSAELSELLFAEAGRALKPGGVMLTVYNSHLPHRARLEKLIGPTVQLGRNQKFTVTRSVRRETNENESK